MKVVNVEQPKARFTLEFTPEELSVICLVLGNTVGNASDVDVFNLYCDMERTLVDHGYRPNMLSIRENIYWQEGEKVVRKA